MAQRLSVQYVQFYTDGSAARKFAPLAPLKTMKLPKINTFCTMNYFTSQTNLKMKVKQLKKLLKKQ